MPKEKNFLNKDFTFTTPDHKEIFVRKWYQSQKKPQAILQIAHGMTEHIARYAGFAENLVAAGIVVYGNDQRGHGRTAGSEEELGHFADEDGWNKVILDMYQLTKQIKSEYPKTPIFLLGHSMGSFLSRCYIQSKADAINGIILSGTGSGRGILGRLGIRIVQSEMALKGKRARSKLLDKLSFGSFNNEFKPQRTAYDWLCSNNKEVDKYIKDPYCGAISTTSFYLDLLKGVSQANSFTLVKKVPKNLPIYLFSGSEDPVGERTKGIMEVFWQFKKAGIKDINCKFYPGRHELYHEFNKYEVYQDVVNWIKNRI